jgi:hypothetical protein
MTSDIIPSYEQSINNFIQYFKKDMTEFLDNNTNNNKFRSVVVGGYGLKLLLENKYNIVDKIKTKDLDITLSSYKSIYSEDQIIQYILNKLITFIRLQPNPKDYKVSIIQGSMYVPVLNYTRKAIIMVSYKYNDFVDIAVTDAKITKKLIDKQTTIKTGLPLKTINEYLLELLTIIYRSNVLDVSPELYDKRNPVTGFQSQKGVQDIDRAKLICNMSRLKKYKSYCQFINSVSINKLFSSTPKERSKFFNALKNLLSLNRKIIKQYLKSDKELMSKAVMI